MFERVLVGLFVTISVAWHLTWFVAPPDPGAGPRDRVPGRDFATYYYAAEVALAGGDPWEQAALDAASQADGIRGGVHPWLYPPPALLAVAWAPSLPLAQAVRVWTAIQELCLLAAAIVLGLWWRPLGPVVPAAIAGWIAFTWGVPSGLAMGQINAMVLLLVVAGLAATDRDREVLGGALLGAACLLKMAPALWLLWWGLRGRWRAVGAALGTAALACVAVLPVVGPAAQLRFFTEVVPGFANGSYNGMVVKISLFANHSLPNLVDQALPGDGQRLTTAGTGVSLALAFGLVAGLGWAFRVRSDDPWQVAGQVTAVGAAGLLIPVYTFEHHLVFAIPGAVAVTAAVVARRLHPAWWLAVVAVAVGLAWPHVHLRGLAEAWPGPVGWALQELKCGALIALLAAGIRLGTSPAREGEPLGTKVPRGFTTTQKA